MVLGLPPCMLCQLPHIALAVCLIASAVKNLRWNRHAQILFHALAGAILLLVPELLHRPMISGGAFDQVQTYLQRSTAPFHLGFAIYHFCNSFMGRSKAAKNPLILFVKALVAYLLLLNNLASAYLLYEQRVRGQHPSQNFLGCSLLVYGVWLGTELYLLFNYTGNPYTDEIELKWLSTRTRRWAEAGSTGIGIERVLFWQDSLICFVGAMFQFAFSKQFLNIMIRREHPIGPLHEIYSREFAVQWLASGILSLVAQSQFTPASQKSYLAFSLTSQSLLFLLNTWAHFGLGLFAPTHILPFLLNFFHCALLFALSLRICSGEKVEEINGNSVSTATVTLCSQTQTVQKTK